MSKQMIIKLFENNVKGKCADTSSRNVNHDGWEGHWLEQQFGIEPNSNNGADLFGYELKKETSSKTSFGDWSANRYIFKTGSYFQYFEGDTFKDRQNSFCQIFGKPNPHKNNRYSWSGSSCPKINSFNEVGQKLVIDDNGDIVAIYCYTQDTRLNKYSIVPIAFQQEDLELARWFGKSSPSNNKGDKCLKLKLEDKFNDAGWFTIKKDGNGRYKQLCFGEPINFDRWLNLIKEGTVFFDSGMYQGNSRPYSLWRANNKFWDSLITEIYE
ncbi:MAG: restriction endonuclease [Epulopiscium sp. Nele67-Bin005]|nr:MAG: restriction endonuclease [Epulopiscium sp. Nele67-Bin005]